MWITNLLNKLRKNVDEITTELDIEELERRFWKDWKNSGKEELPEIGEVIKWAIENNRVGGGKWRSISKELPNPGQLVILCDHFGCLELNRYSGGDWEEGTPVADVFWYPVPEIIKKSQGKQ